MKIYLDSNFFIRFLESEDPILGDFFRKMIEDGVPLVTSELTLMEVLTGSLRDEDEAEIAAYEELLMEGGRPIDVLSIDRPTLPRAAATRVELGNKTPDAIHVATALEAGCDVFVSSDRKLKVPSDMRKVALDELGTLP